MPDGRVLIAFNDGPLEPDPTWTAIDQGGDFPEQFVAGYDTHSGRQTLLAQTDTGTAVVYINDHDDGLFDPRNSSSPWFGGLDGKQIMLQLYDPTTDTWEPQMRGRIDMASYEIDGSAVNAAGEPINASVQLECVDMMDYLAGFHLTPGLAGVRPPVGGEDGVWYAQTNSVGTRIVEILADALVDPDLYIVAQGTVHVKEVKYDPDESALVALRDACDSEFPFIANMYCNRHGQYVFRGKYSRFAPDDVAAEAGSDWDFTRWPLGDGAAIQADPSRGQMRVLAYQEGRGDVINVAVCYPKDMAAAHMPNQVYADPDSIEAYGTHAAPPMANLLTDGSDVYGTFSDTRECFLFAKLLVKNQKDPRVALSRLQVKSLPPTDSRADATWDVLCRSDISHIVNVAVGYPGGTGLLGDSPDDDYYIEGRALKVRPLNPTHDYVELDLSVTPAVWSMDTFNVFPPFGGSTTADGVNAVNSSTVNVTSTSSFPSSGSFYMEGVTTSYSGKTSTSFTGCGDHPATTGGESVSEPPPLTADFDYGYEGGDPASFSFTDQSLAGPSGPITAWAWDFGDGDTDTTQNTSHTYSADGTYLVTLEVTGTGGDGTDSEGRLVKVSGI